MSPAGTKIGPSKNPQFRQGVPMVILPCLLFLVIWMLRFWILVWGAKIYVLAWDSSSRQRPAQPRSDGHWPCPARQSRYLQKAMVRKCA